MNLDEFETQYRTAIENNLNQLQTAVLLIAQLETIVTNVGQDLQNLTLTFEEYVDSQRNK
ncbi:hypothetical protein UH38_07580 [Aliterella atlantica CENA595]|jgi:hypothetical protein|uniref:Uncharacterized protein n=2 Tax=Aliterella TaxID=1827277 RepID=A0A0D8ZU83_9CYAN|nr:hypothetical protein UH38_07580 [Aliterella atlantica CENA595]